MSSAGPNYAGTVADDNSIGTIAWTNPTNAQGTSDAIYATANQSNVNTTHYLKATNYGFNIPAGATINGIQVEIHAYDNGQTDGGTRDTTVKMVKGGTISGNNLDQNTNWPSTVAYRSYGGSSNLWGLSWTPSDINASNFGVALSNGGSGGLFQGCAVDDIRITITYTPAGDKKLPLLGVG